LAFLPVSAGGIVDDEGDAGVAVVADVFGVIVVSAAAAIPIAERPSADAISACAMRLFSLSTMSTPSKLGTAVRRRNPIDDARSLPTLSA